IKAILEHSAPISLLYTFLTTKLPITSAKIQGPSLQNVFASGTLSKSKWSHQTSCIAWRCSTKSQKFIVKGEGTVNLLDIRLIGRKSSNQSTAMRLHGTLVDRVDQIVGVC